MVRRQRGGQLMGESIDGLISKAFKVIELRKRGLISDDEALDALWEIIINIEYETRRSESLRVEGW
ncbi:hypothetical protein [Vulcanisaeta distributa]|uniref:hypothetical protein n=1 Tax=Vulcanisaeta distributa TaxID=164451 RepID=UPI0006CF36D7|nr:hypothetical protein [Vulcanisaeta distributa]